MNLFCVGLSHHTANVETRERFVGHAAIDRILREDAGCTEALLLTTCNRVEVYAASEEAVQQVITVAAASSEELAEVLRPLPHLGADAHHHW